MRSTQSASKGGYEVSGREDGTKISIIIPAKNEERVLPRLLDCLAQQTFRPHEVIVGDADSTDRTAEIVRSRGFAVVRGGLPARGRNAGAAAATGSLLFFFDSDVTIEADFIERAAKKIRALHLECGTAYNRPHYYPSEKGYTSVSVRLFDRTVYFLHNIGLILSFIIQFPYATGTFLFCTRELFHRIGGFDESLTAFEDSEFVNRAQKLGKYGVIKDPPVLISTRRFDRNNRVRFALYVMARGFLARSVFGEKRTGEYFEARV
jgi:glycosyltransferase involved in cell wall biosynthesis